MKKTVIKLLGLGFLIGVGSGRVEAGDAAPECAPGEVLVRLRGGAAKSLAESRALDSLHARYDLVAVERMFLAGSVRRRAKMTGVGVIDRWVRLELDSSRDPRAIAADYARLEVVEQAQGNCLRRFAGVPNDSLFEKQWNLVEMGWDQAEFEEADSVVVAVVDSGLDYRHPDIADQVWQNAAEAQGAVGVDDDGNGYVDDVMGWDFTDAPGLPGGGDYLERDGDPDDESGHGTHVAGIIAAGVGNRTGIAGIAPGARLMVLRAGFNLPGGGYLEDDDVAAAVVYAADNGADVVNMSWGDPFFSPLLRDVIRYAGRAGCVLVAAAGNEGNDQVFYPARLDETIAVAASAPQGQGVSFSNWGHSIDLAAPGHGILSLAPGGGYIERSGTSMAAAHVSGLAALVLGRNPHFTAREVLGALALTARDVGSGGWGSRWGAGIAQVAAHKVDRPAVLQITTPISGTVLDDSSEVRVVLGGIESWEVSWGVGKRPGSWQVLARGEGSADGQVQTWWNTSGLVEGTYLLSARGVREGRWLEDRVEVRLRRRGPVVEEVRLFRALDGPDWAHLVEWKTDVRAGGTVFIERDGNNVVQVPAVPKRTTQRIQLPGDLDPGRYAVQIAAAVDEETEGRVSAGEIAVEPRGAGWGFSRLARFPDGYLMPRIADVDGDGKAELAQMPYGGLQYNTGDFYRLEEGKPELAHSSSLLFIPWNVHDLDGDGRAEIMAVDALRVRLLEASRTGRFPDRVIWEQRDVWGGEVADLDGDGRVEMFLRSGQGNFFQVFESTGDDGFAEVAVLSNPGRGTNELGQRQVVGDLDGDGRGELLGGDGDGDLFVFENIADDAYRLVWEEEEKRENVDARVTGGGADLDGDGRAEFLVARLIQEPFELRQTRWVVSVYQAVGDNAFAEEWQVEVLGGRGGGNGIAMGDWDGDGDLEFALALVPDLYVFQSTGTDAYEPVWHASIDVTHRPAVGDLDGDGRVELVVNADGGVEAFVLERTVDGPERPAGFNAFALDESRIALEWEAVKGAAGYRVFRDGEVIADGIAGFRFEDEGLEEGQVYRFAVAALDSLTGSEGGRTAVLEVRPETPLRVLEIRRLSPHQLAIVFTGAVEISDRDTYRFRVDPGPGMPSSVLPDQGYRRALLSFEEALPDSGIFQLEIAGLRSIWGVPLAEEDRLVDFVLRLLHEPARPLGAEVLSPTRIALDFSRGVIVPEDREEVFSLFPPGLRIEAVETEGSRVLLELAEETPLRPLGRRYEVVISGLEDEEGNRVDGRLAFRFAATSLDQARAFPNPFFSRQGALTFGFLTPEATVFIYDLSGTLVQVLEESNGDGGVQWDGSNSAGRSVASGVYFFKVVSGAEARTGKFALIRE